MPWFDGRENRYLCGRCGTEIPEGEGQLERMDPYLPPRPGGPTRRVMDQWPEVMVCSDGEKCRERLESRRWSTFLRSMYLQGQIQIQDPIDGRS